MRIIQFSILTLAVTAPAAAQKIPSDEVIVTANRAPERADRVGQAVSVLDKATIAERQTATVADLLRTTPGVSIARNGGIGGLASVFIRGAESDQTVALIDGVKLNDPSQPGGGFNFGNLLTGNITRIEVLRGPSSVLWGSQAIGGVVNLITLPPSDRLTVNARAEYGYRNQAQVVANLADTLGPLAISAGGGYFRSDGISAFSEARGGRERDGYRNFGANLNLRLRLSDAISLDARGYYSDGHSGIDGFPPPAFAFADTRESDATREFVGYGGANIALFGGRLRNRFGYAHTDTGRRNVDPDANPVEQFRASGRNERIEYQGIADVLTGVQAIFGYEREISRYWTRSVFSGESRARARIDSGYGQLSITPVAALTLTGGVRHDEHDRFGGATTFSGSGVFTPNHGATALRASYSEGFKAPSLFQLQSDFGNQTLRPERAKGWDVELRQRAVGGAVEASATYFRRDSTDLIGFVSCFGDPRPICAGRPFGTYDNVTRARAEGVELGLAIKPEPALSLGANYTYVDARDRSPGGTNQGRKLARRPGQTINAVIDYQWRFGLSTGATISHVGGSFEDAANRQKLEGYVLVDLRAAMPITDNIEVYGRIENLFEARYETALRYGSPGRGGFIGVRLRR